MSTYAIGDLQGCFQTLEMLLAKIVFDPSRDRLWFVGDLVNRGPGSLECLRFVRQLADRAVVVLGNHDLHLLAVAEGLGKTGKHDTLASILAAPDRDDLLNWLRHRKMLHAEGDFVMIHAGLLPQWDLSLAMQLAREVESALGGDDYRSLLANMYGNEPDAWRDDLAITDRLRITINALTRMRVVNGVRMDVNFKGELASLPKGRSPWFECKHPSFESKTIIAGHWSALGLHASTGFIGIDTGCVWGRELTAIRLEDRKIFQVPCAESSQPVGWD
ncbi:MAG: symmetrical bis(5'-nucleosyl)-tetraphosphatase [Betaproteobacteria bacterium]